MIINLKNLLDHKRIQMRKFCFFFSICAISALIEYTGIQFYVPARMLQNRQAAAAAADDDDDDDDASRSDVT